MAKINWNDLARPGLGRPRFTGPGFADGAPQGPRRGRARLNGDPVADSVCPKKLSFVQKIPIDRIAWLGSCDFR
jgi:hypothetical protein